MSEPIPSPSEPASLPPRRTGRLLAGLFLVLFGVAWLLEALDVVEVPWDVFLPGALILIGAILVVNSRTGASQGGLISLGIVLTLLLFIGTAIEFPFGGGVGERTVAPTTLAVADDGFELGIGQLTVDLSDLPVVAAGDEPTMVRARVGIGQLVVIVPSGVAVRVDGKAGLGNVKVFETEEGGIDADVVVEPPGGAEPVLDLRLSVGIGEVSVELG